MYYYETFQRVPLPKHTSSSSSSPDAIAARAAAEVVRLAFPPKNVSDCLGLKDDGNADSDSGENADMTTVPVLFGVTNFDPANAAGQPNFDDVPANGIRGKKFGVFKTMTVRTTTVVSKAIEIVDEL